MGPVPQSLADQPFTTAQARSAGVSDTMLRGRRFRRLFQGVHIVAAVEPTFVMWLSAARLILPADAVVSHFSALQLYGLDIGTPWPLHFSTNTPTHARQRGVSVHRRLGLISSRLVGDIPVTGPDRTLVDIAMKVNLVELVQAADWMIHCKLTTLDTLTDYALSRHLNGVRKMRRTLALVREGVESPMETVVRLMIVFARLPEPRCNQNIYDDEGRFLARGDLVYFKFKVLVEYDGWHHERDSKQRQRDRERREALEGAGWRVIVVTSEDLKNKPIVVRRVHTALVQRGYLGTRPQFNVMWTQWFA